jgi:hypothetical protein
MRQRVKDMADKLRQKGQGGQSSKPRHKARVERSNRIEEQMKKLQERRHRHR